MTSARAAEPVDAAPAVAAPGEAGQAGDAATRAQPQASAWQRPAVKYSFLVLVAALVFAADQLSKAVVMATMRPGDSIPLIPPVLDLHYITNRGVAFGLFAHFGDAFIPVAIVIMAIIVAYYRGLRTRRLWLRTALGMQLGGALGNLLDRLRYGSVVDFLDFHIDAINFRWPVFNLADSAIVIGVGILLACLTFQQEG
jgi:signal peptidase II